MKGKVECFEDLFVWQKAIEFAKDIYILTERKGLRTDFGLKNQMRDAAVSISTNIAEGFERRSQKEYLNFLNIAKGSAGESRSLLFVVREVGYIDKDEQAVFFGKSQISHWFARKSNEGDFIVDIVDLKLFPSFRFPLCPFNGLLSSSADYRRPAQPGSYNHRS